jgi:hypothetical protein
MGGERRETKVANWNELLGILDKGNDPGQTLTEICEETGKGRTAVTRLVKLAITQGKVKVGKRGIEDSSGRVNRHPVYEWVGGK